MSNLNEEDLAQYNEAKELRYSTDLTIGELLKEWEDLIEELSEKEIDYYYTKRSYQALSDKIISETDFKSLYGANNQKVRDNHVRNELSDLYNTIKTLEFSIDWIQRRISFIRELTHVKRTIMENKK
ncbi:hypothetical protein [uncultured Methanobrevibacter sp.]|uniref:hypothetical protein n=1 Tax=uncultured Methanobrevibacter sp. TaxID=253161 RepID=UPI00258B5044|nr:hypothetical protein [uncultured Methanobrevibacter sp.]